MIPNLFIVGAARCGTTSLATLISSSERIWHPAIKEPKTLAIKSHSASLNGPGDRAAYANKPKNFEDYLNLYSSCRCEYALDASTSYLYYADEAIDNIRRISSSPKIIIILRDPVKRAVSQYQLMLREGRETLGFAEAIDREPERIEQGWEYAWHYRSVGQYLKHVHKYQNSGLNTLIITFEQLVQDTSQTAKRLNAFLQTDISSKALTKENASNLTYPSWIQKLRQSTAVMRIAKNIPSAIKDNFKEEKLLNLGNEIDKSTVMQLEQFYKNEVVELKKAIDVQELGWSCE